MDGNKMVDSGIYYNRSFLNCALINICNYSVHFCCDSEKDIIFLIIIRSKWTNMIVFGNRLGNHQFHFFNLIFHFENDCDQTFVPIYTILNYVIKN